MNEQIITKCLKNLNATVHFTSLVKSRFYSGTPSQGNMKLVAAVEHEPRSKCWQILGHDGKPLFGASFKRREHALEFMSSTEFRMWFNDPKAWDSLENTIALAHYYGAVVW